MAYEVLARKWRPKTFDDVVGQEHVTRTLRHAIQTGRVAHAYLFVGPRGIGKTTLSRIFAKAINCQHPNGTNPCGECEVCRSITEGNSLDVIEIDGASNNKVEDIHEILDQVQFAPAVCKYKIYIIDEVHMLTTSSFNALLKTLEEPPPHLKFIFATTEGDKVLPTIVSRCQRFDLHKISTPMIVKRLRFICNAEKIEIDDDALLAIARGAEGGMRDALSALDQLISFKGEKLSEEDVLAVFGLISRRSLEELATAILKGDMGSILKFVALFDSAGKNMRRLTVELMEYFRNLLVYQYVGEKTVDLDVAEEQIPALAEQAKLADATRILKIVEQLAALEGELRFVLSVRTRIEMTLIRCARIANEVSLDEILRKLTALKAKAGAAVPIPALSAVPPRPAVSPLPPAQPQVPAYAPPQPAGIPRPDSGLSVSPADLPPSPAGQALHEMQPLPQPEEPKTKPLSGETAKALYDDPILKQTLESFNGEVVGIEDDDE